MYVHAEPVHNVASATFYRRYNVRTGTGPLAFGQTTNVRTTSPSWPAPPRHRPHFPSHVCRIWLGRDEAETMGFVCNHPLVPHIVRCNYLPSIPILRFCTSNAIALSQYDVHCGPFARSLCGIAGFPYRTTEYVLYRSSAHWDTGWHYGAPGTRPRPAGWPLHICCPRIRLVVSANATPPVSGNPPSNVPNPSRLVASEFECQRSWLPLGHRTSHATERKKEGKKKKKTKKSRKDSHTMIPLLFLHWATLPSSPRQ